MMILRFAALLFFFLQCSLLMNAQDTITMLSGKTMVVKSTELSGYNVNYRTMKKKGKLKHLNAESVFSIRHADGTEFVVYLPDSLDADDYTVSEMRMYIKGEQDAMKYYRNNLNKVGAFAFGVGSAYFAFYGIVGPAIYASVVGAFVPPIDKLKVSDPALLEIGEYRTGYERKARNKKTVNAILYGLAGFATGFVTFSIIGNNN